jgi:lipopolysaccharide transport system ATP-binding protein
LCSRAILLHNGRIFSEGETRSVIRTYLQSLLPETSSSLFLDITERKGTGDIQFTDFHVEDIYGNKLSVIQSGQDVVFVFKFKCKNKQLRNIDFGIGIYTLTGEKLTIFHSQYKNQIFEKVPKEGEVRCIIKRFPFAPGRYIIKASVTVNNVVADSTPLGIGYIDVVEGDFWKTGRIPKQSILFLIDGEWFLK